MSDSNDAQLPPPGKTILPYEPRGATRGVTIETFFDPLQAQLVANKLKERGIECFLLNQNVSGLGAYASFCQVELQVREQDVTRAQGVVAEFQVKPSDATPIDSSEGAEQPDDADPRCPECGSYRLIEAPRPWPGLWKFLTGTREAGKPEMECLRCHHRWPA